VLSVTCVGSQLALLAKEDEVEADFEKQVLYNTHTYLIYEKLYFNLVGQHSCQAKEVYGCFEHKFL